MQRQGFSIPLLIGGATTSKVHTAVKIAPHYQHPVIYVPDASRAVGVCSNLLSDTLRDGFVAENQAEQDRAREGHANKASRKVVGLEQARANKEAIDWAAYQPPTPRWLGVRREHYPLAEIAAYIDWTPFFQSWELAGRFPRILNDEIVGESARALYEDAQVMLKQIIAENWLGANAVIGLFPAASVNHDDIEIRDPDNRASLMSWVACASNCPRWTARPTGRWPTISRRGTAACRTISAPSPSPPASASSRTSSASRMPATTTPPSYSRRWLTGWPKPSPN